MSQTCPVVKIKSDSVEAGFIVINESDFDEKVHELFVEDDEGAKKADLTVAQIKEALAAKGVEIPEGAKKADLLALLNAE